MAARLRGHQQRKLNGHVYSFLLFVSSRPHYQAEFQYIESGLFTGTHLYTWVERGTVRVKCLAQEHYIMSLARARTQTARS